jgi:hypothetical protein
MCKHVWNWCGEFVLQCDGKIYVTDSLDMLVNSVRYED